MSKSAETIEVDSLESRRVMAATPLPATLVPYGNGTMLKITGTAASDTITLSYNGTAYTVATATGFKKTFAGPLTAVRIAAAAGNDKVTVAPNITTPVFLLGEDGNDTLTGGGGDDTIVGGNGTNWLYGQGGRDTLISLGGAATDGLTGGDGADFFWADDKPTEKIYDAAPDELARTVNRVTAFETSKFVTGTKTQAIATTPMGQRFRDPDVADKTLTYKPFTDRPLFSPNGPGIEDVRQGQAGDCYFLSTLAGVAQVSPDTIRNMITDLGDGTYAVRFKQANGTAKFFRVDNDLATTKNSTTPAYAGLGTGNCMWVAIAEKAFAYARKSQGTYTSLNAGWMTEAYTAVGATAPKTIWRDDSGSADAYLDWVAARLAAGDVVTLAVYAANDGLNLVGGHAYTVSHVQTLPDGTRRLIIRNPWAMDGYRTTDGANDGYVTLTAQQAKVGIDAFVAAKAA